MDQRLFGSSDGFKPPENKKGVKLMTDSFWIHTNFQVTRKQPCMKVPKCRISSKHHPNSIPAFYDGQILKLGISKVQIQKYKISNQSTSTKSEISVIVFSDNKQVLQVLTFISIRLVH